MSKKYSYKVVNSAGKCYGSFEYISNARKLQQHLTKDLLLDDISIEYINRMTLSPQVPEFEQKQGKDTRK